MNNNQICTVFKELLNQQVQPHFIFKQENVTLHGLRRISCLYFYCCFFYYISIIYTALGDVCFKGIVYQDESSEIY